MGSLNWSTWYVAKTARTGIRFLTDCSDTAAGNIGTIKDSIGLKSRQIMRTIAVMGRDEMDDLISRQAAIDAVLDRMNVEKHGRDAKPEEIQWTLEKLPSAQPEHTETHSCDYQRTETHGWILCSERMPEEHEWIGTKKFGTTISNEVYVTFEAPDGERFAEHISFQNGKLSSVDEQRMKVWYKGAKPIAWMPLPTSYKEDEDARN